MEMKVTLIECPNEMDWIEVRRRCLVTAGKEFDGKVPSMEWRRKLLEARHSPIRYLRFSFYIECPGQCASLQTRPCAAVCEKPAQRQAARV